MNRDEIEKFVKELPPGCELFIPTDVADAIFGTNSAELELNKIATANECSIGCKQSFQLTPDNQGFRIARPKKS